MNKSVPAALASGVEQVPSVDFLRQYRQIEGEVLAAIAAVCSSQKFVNGPDVAAFEQEAARFVGAASGIGCASGTDALWLSLLAADIGRGDEVVTTPFTFFATGSAILRAGARPVLVDIDPLTFNLDVARLEHRLKSKDNRLKAIMPVHLYGQCVNMDEIRRLAQEHKLVVVEDAAQAFGATWRGQKAGSLGDLAAFSFYPTKNLSCFGDGGLVTTSREHCAERARMLRNHGMRRRYHHDELGGNSRLDSIQAAVLRVKLKYVERWNSERRARAHLYGKLFQEAGLAQPPSPELKGKTGLQIPYVCEAAGHVFHQYVIRAARRDELHSFLAGRNIGAEVYYPVPLNMQPPFRFLGYTEEDLPESARTAREVLALPIFPEITEPEQRHVVETIAEFYS